MTLEEELNKIASEIKELGKVITPPFNVVTRMDKIKLGMSMLEHQKLMFTFNRMLHLADKALLSDEAMSISVKSTDPLNEILNKIETEKEFEQVKEMLNKDNA